MLALALALTLCEPPPVELLDELPGWYVCDTQLERYRRHKDWLRYQERIHGWADGRYQVWQEECDFALAYWRILYEAQNLHRIGPEWDDPARGFLAALLRLVGPYRFGLLWHPPMLDAPPEEPEPPVIPNAAGD